MELGLFCARMVVRNGGVLEQPAGSKLWGAAKLPMPNRLTENGLWTCYVEQGWFGYATRKPTWLLLQACRKTWSRQSHLTLPDFVNCLCISAEEQRSRTMPKFAEWLCQIARLSNSPALSDRNATYTLTDKI